MASCPTTDPRSRKFVAPPRPQQSQQPSKRPVYGDKKLLEAKQAKKAARKAARQTPSCDMVTTDPAALQSSPAIDDTSGGTAATTEPADEAVVVSGIRNFDTTTSKPAPWQPITTSPITSQELSKLAVGPTSAAGAPILRLYATTAVLPAILAPTGCAADEGPLLPQPFTDPPPAATAEQPHLQPPPPPDAGAPRPLWQRLIESSLVGLLHVVLAVPVFIFVVATA